MNAHLPVLAVLTPLLSAPLCLMLRRKLAARFFAIAVAWITFAIAISTLQAVMQAGDIRYELGGFAPPLGIELRVDATNALMLLLVSSIAAVVLLFGPGSAGATIAKGREPAFYTLLLLALAGLIGITVTGDAFNVFVFLEVSSLASYTLIGLGNDRHAPMSAFSYLIMGTLGGTFFLLGVGLLYQMTGTLNMADLTVRLQDVHGSRTVVLALALLVVGIGIKLAVFPLHQWLPNAYSHAPSVVSAFLAATSTKVMYYVLVRVLFTLFGAAFVFETLRADYLLMPLSILAMFGGSLAAIYQTNLKRLLAYSSVAQVGYMTLGLSFASVTGVTAGLVHVFNHALMKGGLFLVVGCITAQLGSSDIARMRGLGKRMPLTMAAFVVGGFALIGVPATVGFVSKWYLVQAALEKGMLPVAFLILLSSILAVVYIWRVVEIAYFQEPEAEAKVSEAPLNQLLPTWLLIGSTLFFGLNTDVTVGVAQMAARQLMGVLP
ncbi:MAG: monovalent cation/H+ antiporter subunit D family protein [Myxococcales bacterium]|nr:monovalent cation/H+ antiporter subunit D family protein [Myxococcales bacterium]